MQQVRIYPLTDHKYLFGRSHSERITEIIEGGAGIVQLRDKESPMDYLLSESLTIRNITRKKDVLFIVNDRVDLALMSDADGVHLGQDDIPVEYARGILGDSAIIGLSTHSVEQIQRALTTSADYIAFGPIYHTGTKDNPDPVQGLPILNEIVAIVDRPLFAIGGINLLNINEVLQYGVTGAAVIADIFSFPDATDRMKKYLEQISQIKQN
ncbi:MAG: thiamine-phosphate diphosphorylase [Candidatus Schekmanbacteria bacterium RBG_13_48_7]|uniref:Thiamine-phosphate synthase n=1 Tax=Candidatus Schekmanbacteria bacterium RBG_13_48_7 TaxID=1817878 RepID=A0A1F7RLS0_9BACT|nr:MAG: thiamine-phosphate diphosphorylase [Candidatus Schekmanbacteria bacterium RBG_13_48_7]